MNWRWRIAQYFELKWWKLYLNKKDKEHYLQQKRTYWLRLYALMSPYLHCKDNDRILDLGCGPSGIYMLFDKNKVTAVDPLISAYEKNLNVFSKTRYPTSEFVTNTIEQFSPAHEYDIVFCMNAINHVADINAAYKKLATCTAKKGHMVLTIDAHNYGLFRFLFRLMPGDILHPHQYNLNEYTHFAETHNFKVLECIKIKKEFFFDHYMMVTERV